MVNSTRPLTTTRVFVCSHCGRCCEKIFVHLDGGQWAQPVTAGILLLPGEQHLFPHTTPMWRSGAEVLAYQMDREPCPHWTGKGCAIYNRRPLACRAYPVWWEIVWRADTNCPQVTAVGQLGEYREEITSAHDILRFQRWLYAMHKDLEYFDLTERVWKRV